MGLTSTSTINKQEVGHSVICSQLYSRTTSGFGHREGQGNRPGRAKGGTSELPQKLGVSMGTHKKERFLESLCSPRLEKTDEAFPTVL